VLKASRPGGTRIGEHDAAVGDEIGRDCVGAIRLTTEDEAPPDVRKIDGDLIDESDIERLLDRTLGGPTLGRNDGDIDWDFRISLAGAQEKTALPTPGWKTTGKADVEALA